MRYCLLILMLCALSSCIMAKRSYYVYGSSEFAEKEKELTIKLTTAAAIAQDFTGHKGRLYLTVIYDDYYVFSEKTYIYHFNPKVGYGNSGVWVSGKDARFKRVERGKYIPMPYGLGARLPEWVSEP